jgi:dienelactone hydrolase
MSGNVHQQVVMIGARKTMVGMMTQPVDYEQGDRPVVVILNSGIIHRVGHHRMYVVLARMLAGAGCQVLRFDLFGIGNSEGQVDSLSPLEGALADVREAVDWLVTARRARRIILVGLCSGADHSLIYGSSNPRICGLVLLDPSIPPTPAFFLRDLLRHLSRPQSWINVFLVLSRRLKRLRKLPSLAGEVRQSYWPNLNEPVIRDFLQNAYQRSMDRGVQCLIVFTSVSPYQHNYRRQIIDAFPTVPFAGRLRLEYLTRCDHLFTRGMDRKRLFDTMMAWTQETRFGGQIGTEASSEPVVDPNSRDRVSYEV